MISAHVLESRLPGLGGIVEFDPFVQERKFDVLDRLYCRSRLYD
jgi:hypothetical protein